MKAEKWMSWSKAGVGVVPGSSCSGLNFPASIFLPACLLLILSFPLRALDIREAHYEGRAQFVVKTASTEYWLDKNAEGFSRLIDRDGHDWISFHKEPLSKFLDDTFWYLGSSNGGAADAPDGMVVFGFGRGPGKPLFREPREFVVSLVEARVTNAADHGAAAAKITGLLK